MKLRSNLTSKEWDKREVSAILYYGQPPVREERLDIVCADGEVRRGVCEKIGLLLTKNEVEWKYDRKLISEKRRREITRKLGYSDEASVYMENEIAREECFLIEWKEK